MTKRSHAALALLLSPWLLLAGQTAAHAQAANAGLHTGENLLAPIPGDFKPGGTIDDSGMNLSTFLPQKETNADWTQMITTQVYRGMTKYDPDKFAQILGAKWKGFCKAGAVTRLSGGMDNGYPVAIWQFTCPLNPNTHKPESMWMKLIAGNDSLYNAHYSYRVKVTPALTKHALAYLQYVTVCDTRAAGHPCAPPEAAKPAAPAPTAATPTAKPAVPAQPTTAQPTAPAQPENHMPSAAPAQIAPGIAPGAKPAAPATPASSSAPATTAAPSPAPATTPATPKPAGQ